MGSAPEYGPTLFWLYGAAYDSARKRCNEVAAGRRDESQYPEHQMSHEHQHILVIVAKIHIR